MRYAGLIAAVVLGLACGPDPNAKLPGLDVTVSGGAGGAGSGGIVGTGGTIEGSGGITTTVKGGAGGTSPFGSGGKTGSGGVTGSGGITGRGGTTTAKGTGGTLTGDGGTTSSGARTGTGGAGARDGGGTGGVGARDGGRTEVGVPDVPGTGGNGDIDGGGGDEPCVGAKTITGGQSGAFGTTGAFCFRTSDNIPQGWNCSEFDGRTVKVNGVQKACGTMPLPAKVNGYYYFDSSAGTKEFASIYWY